ncbi:hypothetical protein K502DRAFT_349708 [Neoconidiobolus thromboides FSU 785]|nr:hypothetical protein K502DRAFT_349708 [Neoconidiobolus thromboides FSU 785]
MKLVLIIAFLAAILVAEDRYDPFFSSGRCTKINNKLYTFGEELITLNHFWHLDNTGYSLDLDATINLRSSKAQREHFFYQRSLVPVIYNYDIKNKSWDAKEDSSKALRQATNNSESNISMLTFSSLVAVTQNDSNLDEYFLYYSKGIPKENNNSGVEVYNRILYLINGEMEQDNKRVFKISLINLKDESINTKFINSSTLLRLEEWIKPYARNANYIYFVQGEEFNLGVFDLEELSWHYTLWSPNIKVKVQHIVVYKKDLLFSFATYNDGDKSTPVISLENRQLINSVPFQTVYNDTNKIIGGVIGSLLGLLLVSFGFTSMSEKEIISLLFQVILEKINIAL